MVRLNPNVFPGWLAIYISMPPQTMLSRLIRPLAAIARPKLRLPRCHHLREPTKTGLGRMRMIELTVPEAVDSEESIKFPAAIPSSVQVRLASPFPLLLRMHATWRPVEGLLLTRILR